MEEAYAAITELRLQLLMLENERDALKSENTNLKNNVQQLLISESISAHKAQRRMSEECKNRWLFYHQNKKEVAARLGAQCSWRIVKSETDRMFYEDSAAQKT